MHQRKNHWYLKLALSPCRSSLRLYGGRAPYALQTFHYDFQLAESLSIMHTPYSSVCPTYCCFMQLYLRNPMHLVADYGCASMERLLTVLPLPFTICMLCLVFIEAFRIPFRLFVTPDLAEKLVTGALSHTLKLIISIWNKYITIPRRKHWHFQFTESWQVEE